MQLQFWMNEKLAVRVVGLLRSGFDLSCDAEKLRQGSGNVQLNSHAVVLQGMLLAE